MKTTTLYKYYILFSILLCSISVNGQSIEQRADSIQLLIENATEDTVKAKKYLTLSNLYLYNNPEKSIDYARKVLEISQKGNYSKGVFKAYGAIFTAHHVQSGNSDSLLKYVQLYEKEAIKSGKEFDLMGVYFKYAMYYGNVGKEDKELEAYLKSLKLVQKYIPKSNKEAALLNNIGIIYSSKKQYTETLKYYKAALELTDNNINKANILANCGTVYIENPEKIDSAQVYFDEAMRLYKMEDDLSGIAFVMIYEAKIKDLEQQYERAFQIYSEAFQIIKDNNFGYLLPAIYQVMTKHFYQQNKYTEVISYGEKMLVVAINEQQNLQNIDEIHDMLHRSYAATGNYKKAYEVRGNLMGLNDSINSLELQSKVETLKTEFEVEQKEAENKLLKTNLQSRQYLSIALLIALIFAIALGVLTYKSSQQRKRNNEILEQKVAERTKELEQANYELRTFNYIASHDIKEPIRNIGGHAGLIFRKLPADLKESLGSYFDTIRRSTTELYTLIEDFANYTTMSKNETIETQEVDLNYLTSSVIENLQESIQKYNGQVLFSDLPTIQSSSSLLLATLKNLIGNGLKYNESEQPTVEVTYNKTETHHQIIVSDNGIGISEEYYERIFEMFKRLHNRGEYEGSGIGLAIVKLSVDKLGGTVNLESEEGKGSRFVISIPKI